MTYKNSPNAISSPASASGATPSDKPTSPMTDQSGQEAAPASLSPRQAKEKGLLTSGTYGPHGNTSLQSKNLQQSLASRLQAKTASAGSTLYKLTWKDRVTPSGRMIFALRASVLRTSGNGSGLLRKGWPTPTANPANGEPEAFLERKRRSVAKGSKMGISLTDIQMVAKLAGWPTPCQQDGPKGGPSQGPDRLPGAVSLSGWPTPRANDAEKRGIPASDPRNGNPGTVQLAGWPSPKASNSMGPRNPETILAKYAKQGRTVAHRPDEAAALATPARLTASGDLLTGSTAGMESGGQLNPSMSKWLMGLPPTWDTCAPIDKKTRKK